MDDPVAVLPRPQPAAIDEAPALARRLAAASVVALMGAAGCYLLMVRTSLGQRLDSAAYLGAKAQYGTAAASASDQLQRITADSLALVLLVIVGIGAARRRLLLGVGAAFAAGVAVVATDLLRSHILTRPDLIASGAYEIGNTYPSGHTASAVACAMALVVVAPPRGRGAAAVIAGAYGWVTAAQVQTAGWHRPSDAIGAALIAFASLAAVAALLAARRPVKWHRRGRHRLAFGVLGLVGVVDGAVGVRRLTEVVRYLHTHALGATVSGRIGHDAYITGLAVTVEVVVVLLAVLLILLGRADLDGWGWGRAQDR